MSDEMRGREPDRVDEALVRLKRAYVEGRPAIGLETRIAALVAETSQRPVSWRFDPRRRWPRTGGAGLTGARLALLGLVGVLAVAITSIALIGPRLQGGPIAAQTANAPVGSAPLPGDIGATNAPHVKGTCPVTDITRLGGGTAPEVDVSGLRWRWGGIPWVAGVPEKVVWLTDSGVQPDSGISVFAVRLDRPIVVDGATIPYAGDASRTVYAASVSSPWVDMIDLPEPGCWLLTGIWAGGASSVVVAAALNANPGPPGGTPSAQPSTVSHTVDSCPATPTTAGAGAGASGWPGHAYVDGSFRWLVPPTSTWRIGGDGDKLVLYSGVDWDIGDMRIDAIPVVAADHVGWLTARAVAGDIPPGFGGGTLGFGMTLPNRGCWAFAFAGSQATSTIVIDLGA